MNDDLISRKDAIDVAVQSIKDWDGMFIQEANCRIRDAINDLPSVQPEHNRGKMNDLINRQAAIEAVLKVKIVDEDESLVECPAECNAMIDGAVKELEKLPSVQPEQKRGKWIRLSKDLAQCSEYKDYIDNAISCGYNYCPNCGSENEEMQEAANRDAFYWESLND